MSVGLLPVRAYVKEIKMYIKVDFEYLEAYTVVSGQSKACFATLAERKTGYYIAVKIPNRTCEALAKTVIEALSKLSREAVKTITCDCGSKFACWREIEKELNCNMCFADRIVHGKKGQTRI